MNLLILSSFPRRFFPPSSPHYHGASAYASSAQLRLRHLLPMRWFQRPHLRGRSLTSPLFVPPPRHIF